MTLEQALSRQERHHESLAVLFLDLDRFKLVNDSLGHDTGDRLIVEVAHRLRGVLRPTDTVARIGGDEFVILIEDLDDRDEAITVAERVRATVGVPVPLGDQCVVPSVSVGIAFAEERHHSPQQLLREADTAMYRAKERGKDRYEVFDDTLRLRVVERLGTEALIRRALDENAVRVSYQPIVSLATGKIVGAEALMRIATARGLLVPEDFLEVAEDTGLVVPLGDALLAQAVGQAARWTHHAEDGPFQMSVNLCAPQLGSPDLAAMLADLTGASGVVPGALAVELTESVLMDAAASTVERPRSLKALGVTVGIDDFGTGYSSLTYLRQFPVDFLKIDRSFVSGLCDEDDDLAIVRAVVGLGKSLNLTTIAEGVETPEQLRILRDLGCDRAQGHYLAPPLPAADLERLLVRSPHW